MKLSDLINVSKTIQDDKESNKRLTDFISRINTSSPEYLFTIDQIYQLTVECELFKIQNNTYHIHDWEKTQPSQLLVKLNKLVLNEIYSEEKISDMDISKYELSPPSEERVFDLMVLLFKKNNLFNQMIFERATELKKNNITNRFQILSLIIVLNEKEVLDAESIKLIMHVYPELSYKDAEYMTYAFAQIEGCNLNKKVFNTMLFNKYKKWGGAQGIEINHLVKLNMLEEWIDLVLQTPYTAGRLSEFIEVLCKLPTWPIMKKTIKSKSPESQHEILEILYKDYKKEVEQKYSQENNNLSGLQFKIYDLMLNPQPDVPSQRNADRLNSKNPFVRLELDTLCKKRISKIGELKRISKTEVKQEIGELKEIFFLKTYFLKIASTIKKIISEEEKLEKENNSQDKLPVIVVELELFKIEINESIKDFSKVIYQIINSTSVILLNAIKKAHSDFHSFEKGDVFKLINVFKMKISSMNKLCDYISQEIRESHPRFRLQFGFDLMMIQWFLTRHEVELGKLIEKFLRTYDRGVSANLSLAGYPDALFNSRENTKKRHISDEPETVNIIV